MEFPEFIGNRRIVDFFSTHTQKGVLPAGTYVFAGSPGLGKRTLAALICAKLLHASSEHLALHPDYIVLERLTDEKTGKRKRDITVEQARELKRQITTSSWNMGQRFALIDGADTLNEEASNALLKLFEEPPARTVFFLIVQHEQALLPTIRSRAQVFHFSSVPSQDIESALVAKGLVSSIARDIVYASWGRPGRALEFSRNRDAQVEDEGYRARLRALVGQPFYRQSKCIEEWLGKGEEARLDRDELDTALATWTMCIRSELNDAGDSGTIGKIFSRVHAVEEARGLLRRQVNSRLVLEQLALRLG